MKLPKTVLLIGLLVCSDVCMGQILIENFSIKEVPDTLYTDSGLEYAVIITYLPTDEGEPIEFYTYGDSLKTKRTVSQQMVSKVVDNRRERKFVEMTADAFVGKEIYMAAVPFQPAFSKAWKVVVDSGLDEYSGVLSHQGDHLLFKSELAAVNFLIGQGWELYRVMEIEKGSVGFGSAIFGSSAVGGSAKISSTNYLFKKKF